MTDYTGTGRRENDDYEEYIASYHGLKAPLTREQFNKKFLPQPPLPEDQEFISEVLNTKLRQIRRDIQINKENKEDHLITIKDLEEIILQQERAILTLIQTLNHFNLEIKS